MQSALSHFFISSSILEPVDIVFLIDGSEGVGKDDFENELKFLETFVKKFPISEAMTRVALGTISDDGRVDFDFSLQQDSRTIQKNLRLVTYPAGKMNAGKALNKIHEQIFKTYTRSGVAQVCACFIIVVTRKTFRQHIFSLKCE